MASSRHGAPSGQSGFPFRENRHRTGGGVGGRWGLIYLKKVHNLSDENIIP